MTDENPYPRYRIIKIDSLNYKMWIGCGLAAMALASMSVIMSQKLTDNMLGIAAVVFIAGGAVVLFGLDLRTMYRRHSDFDIERLLRETKQ